MPGASAVSVGLPVNLELSTDDLINSPRVGETRLRRVLVERDGLLDVQLCLVVLL